MNKIIIIKDVDNVAIALDYLKPGEEVYLQINNETKKINVIDFVPKGHKIAIKEIRSGDNIIKYGETIGIALRDIRPGEHVHIHNVKSRYNKDYLMKRYRLK